ncbi:DoxX protein [Mesorhizobium albiziae]|uniref:DoxX protein n=1 Tax=Neomesorhizobium albiziae TaxID=335020 RepID=A0A1I4F292_9HYPH|nr:DoxX protein [Mesorhizobium albiziae]
MRAFQTLEGSPAKPHHAATTCRPQRWLCARRNWVERDAYVDQAVFECLADALADIGLRLKTRSRSPRRLIRFMHGRMPPRATTEPAQTCFNRAGSARFFCSPASASSPIRRHDRLHPNGRPALRAFGLWHSRHREILGGIALIVGYQTRLVALGLALFSVATALSFHTNLADLNEFVHFFKNIAMAGDLLQVVALGAGGYSLEARR